MTFALWITAAKAKRLGATHHASMFGIIPGFVGDQDMLWIPRTDALCWLEDALMWLWVTTRDMRGEEPDFLFRVGKGLV